MQEQSVVLMCPPLHDLVDRAEALTFDKEKMKSDYHGLILCFNDQLNNRVRKTTNYAIEDAVKKTDEFNSFNNSDCSCISGAKAPEGCVFYCLMQQQIGEQALALVLEFKDKVTKKESLSSLNVFEQVRLFQNKGHLFLNLEIQASLAEKAASALFFAFCSLHF